MASYTMFLPASPFLLTFFAISIPGSELVAARKPCLVDAYTMRSFIFDAGGQVYMKTMGEGDCSLPSTWREYLKKEYRGSVLDIAAVKPSASVSVDPTSSIVSSFTLMFCIM